MAKPARIVLIHATPVAVEPIRAALAADWPEAEAVNLLDDALATDLARAGALTPALAERIADLARYAGSLGADGILYTCSAFGAAIDRAATLVDVPVLKPNEAMFATALRHGGHPAMLVTFAPARAGMEAEFADEARRRGSEARLASITVEGAMAALRAGDAATHHRLVAEAAAGLTGCDAILLAHFSTAAAADAVRDRTALPVLTAPGAAVAELKRRVAARVPSDGAISDRIASGR
jgi:aspartate/glutamate racemase